MSVYDADPIDASLNWFVQNISNPTATVLNNGITAVVSTEQSAEQASQNYTAGLEDQINAIPGNIVSSAVTAFTPTVPPALQWGLIAGGAVLALLFLYEVTNKGHR